MKIEKDLISVVLTTYNSPSALYRALKSVVKQSYENIEVLVVDGGNNRCTKIAIDSFSDKRITYIKVGDGKSDNRICGNVQYCRNVGVTLSKGKFIAMLDDDDIWVKNKLERQHNLAVISDAKLICNYTNKISGNLMFIDRPLSNPKFSDLLQSFNFSQTSAYFINRKELVKIGGFNEKLRSMHEYDVALFFAKKGLRIDVVKEPLLTSYCDNVTERKYYFTKIAELLDLWRCYGQDMLNQLSRKQMFFNIIKTGSLLSLYLMGYVVKEKIWRIIFKLKSQDQRKNGKV